jgi:hypothetical protein
MSLGVALLVFSLVLAPANQAVGNGPQNPGCPGNKGCSRGCHTKLCFKMYSCVSAHNCLCNKDPKECKDCKCVLQQHDCNCTD